MGKQGQWVKTTDTKTVRQWSYKVDDKYVGRVHSRTTFGAMGRTSVSWDVFSELPKSHIAVSVARAKRALIAALDPAPRPTVEPLAAYVSEVEQHAAVVEASDAQAILKEFDAADEAAWDNDEERLDRTEWLLNQMVELRQQLATERARAEKLQKFNQQVNDLNREFGFAQGNIGLMIDVLRQGVEGLKKERDGLEADATAMRSHYGKLVLAHEWSRSSHIPGSEQEWLDRIANALNEIRSAFEDTTAGTDLLKRLATERARAEKLQLQMKMVNHNRDTAELRRDMERKRSMALYRALATHAPDALKLPDIQTALQNDSNEADKVWGRHISELQALQLAAKPFADAYQVLEMLRPDDWACDIQGYEPGLVGKPKTIRLRVRDFKVLGTALKREE